MCKVKPVVVTIKVYIVAWVHKVLTVRHFCPALSLTPGQKILIGPSNTFSHANNLAHEQLSLYDCMGGQLRKNGISS